MNGDTLDKDIVILVKTAEKNGFLDCKLRVIKVLEQEFSSNDDRPLEDIFQMIIKRLQGIELNN